MSEHFIITCESTVDMPYSWMEKRNIPVIFYSYTVDGVAYADDMLRDPEALPRFYGFLKDGKLPETSQINTYSYQEFFKQQLQAHPNSDILHIAFGTGMTPSYYNAAEAAETVMKEFPGRKITVLDSLCSSSGYGMLVDDAADLAEQGKTVQEISDWVLAHRTRIHHQFFSTELDFYRRSGRMSGPVATIATVLDICPIMRLDDKGKIIAYDKVRGKKRAIQRTIREMEQHAEKGTDYDGKCFICHSDCPDVAERTKKAVQEHFPHLQGEDRIPIFDIGTIIAGHCGPGTVAVFFMGDERQPEKTAGK